MIADKSEKSRYQQSVLTTAALMPLTVATAALVTVLVAMTTAAALVLTGVFVLAVAIAVIAVAVATTAARARAHLLLHALSHLLVCGNGAVVNSHAKVLIHSGEQLIQLHAGLKITAAHIIIHHTLAQLIELGDFLIGRSHTGHLLIAQLLTEILGLAVKGRSIGRLEEEADTGVSRNHFLALREAMSQLRSQLYKLRCKGGI